MNQFEPFTPEQDAWIIDHYWEMTLKELTNRFNEEFGKNRSYAVMKQRTRKTLKLTHKFSEDMKEFLRDGCQRMSRKELTKAFNEKYRQNRTEDVIKVVCNRMGAKFSDNKERMRRARMESGAPIGTIRKFSNGYMFIKVRVGEKATWKLLHTKVWEDANGEVPKGHQIIFLDNNKENCNIENLYCIDGRTHRELTKKKWRFDDPNLTRAAIKWCELFYATKKAKKEDR